VVAKDFNVRVWHLANESTPEERLKKYKESLAKMALSEGKILKLSNVVKEKKSSGEPTATESTPQPSPPPEKENIRPPQVLVSPSKRELRESMISSRTKKGDEFRTTLDKKARRDRVMLKAREKAIDGSLQEIKNRRSMLELQFKKKMVAKDEYDKRMRLLVEEGQGLLKEKAEIDKSLAK
jgi:hypothetical protein